jgi:uncharacterized membrane protein YcaP (DUF421 family)
MELFVRATVIYWFLWIVIRGTGKRSLAELTPLDLLLIVILGDFVQQGVTQEDMSITGALISVSVFVLWTLVADYWGRASKTANRVLASEPVIILRAGEPVMSRLAQERVTLDELKEAARISGYGDLGDLEFGVLEADGRFSFIPSGDSEKGRSERF